MNVKMLGLLYFLTTSIGAQGLWIPQHISGGIYPALANSARLQGLVLLTCSVSEKGSVRSCTAVGHPLLCRAAIANVKDWTFRTLESGMPKAEKIQIRYLFKLGEKGTDFQPITKFSFDFPDLATLESEPRNVDHSPNSRQAKPSK